MRRRRFFVGGFCLTAVAALGARAEDGGPIMASDAWARPSLAGARNGVAYLTLTNHGGAPDRLIGASTPVAERAELHRDEVKDGIMSMRPAGPLAIEPGDMVTLAPGGLHLMLMGLKQPLKPGDRFALTLTFEKQAPLTLEASVGERKGERAAPGERHEHRLKQEAPTPAHE
jgi:copper(I)-binding protein